MSWFVLLCLVCLMPPFVARVDAQRARLNLDAILGERGRSASQTGDRKKQIFQDMKEFRRYLQRLEEWLAITGRPR
uniref:GLUCAGON domain-containing protein n=1 Tax=Mesocestoides corti TaxID=53468 RepID=A0A5K3EV31_MESCO